MTSGTEREWSNEKLLITKLRVQSAETNIISRPKKTNSSEKERSIFNEVVKISMSETEFATK